MKKLEHLHVVSTGVNCNNCLTVGGCSTGKKMRDDKRIAFDMR